MLTTEPIVLFFSLYVASNFGILYCFFAAVPYVFKSVYDFDSGQVGLTFISICVGCLLATATVWASDVFIYQKKMRIHGAHGKGRNGALPPEERLYPAMVGGFGIPLALFWVAWTSRANIHWISPVMAVLPFAWGNLCVFVSNVSTPLDEPPINSKT